MKLAHRRLLSLLSGVLFWLSFPNPFALNFQPWTAYLAWVALVPLCLALWDQAPRTGFLLGWLAGTLGFALSLTWLTNVKPMGPASVPACLALALWCGGFVGAWGWLVGWVTQRKAPLPAVGLAAAWALLELLRERLFTGVPWINLGSSQALNPAIVPLAAITGQVGLHLAVALGNLVIFALVFEQSVTLGLARSASAFGVLLLLAWGAHCARAQASLPQDGPRVKVGVIQGGIDQDQAWTLSYRQQLMNTYMTLTEAAVHDGAQVILWPESAYPGFFNEDAPEARQLKAYARQHNVHFLIGATFSEQNGYRNSAVWIAPDGNTLSQAKRHLVPFGEYVPFRRAVPVLDAAMARLGVSDFLEGGSGPLFNLAGLKTQPLICYESVFPAIPRQGPDPDLLGVITVDTWYGVSAGPVWHASQCALRAVENGCWVAQSAATGISLFASPSGELLQPIPLEGAGYRVAEIPRGRPTIYRKYGEWLAWVLAILLMAMWGPIWVRKS